MNMNMNIGDAHGGRGRRGSLPPPAAAAIAVSSIAVSSIVAIPSTDHVPGGGSVTDGTAEGAKMGEDGSGIGCARYHAGHKHETPALCKRRDAAPCGNRV